jgi:hypothetical protein
MASNLPAAASRAIPGGALFALAIGLMLYLATSLLLGSSGNSRVVDVALSLPSLAVAPETQPNFSRDRISGSRLTPAAPIGSLIRAVPTAAFVAVASTTTPTTTEPVPRGAAARQNLAPPVKPTAVASKRGHYHDADERSHRLARRR